MTPEAAMDLAKFQRPGRMVLVGATEAFDVAEPAVDDQPFWRKNRLGVVPMSDYPPHLRSWWNFDMWRRLGYVPSLWARLVAGNMEQAANRRLSDDEWRWLANAGTGNDAVEKWCKKWKS
jgi:hypothetical protein